MAPSQRLGWSRCHFYRREVGRNWDQRYRVSGAASGQTERLGKMAIVGPIPQDVRESLICARVEFQGPHPGTGGPQRGRDDVQLMDLVGVDEVDTEQTSDRRSSELLASLEPVQVTKTSCRCGGLVMMAHPTREGKTEFWRFFRAAPHRSEAALACPRLHRVQI